MKRLCFGVMFAGIECMKVYGKPEHDFICKEISKAVKEVAKKKPSKRAISSSVKSSMLENTSLTGRYSKKHQS